MADRTVESEVLFGADAPADLKMPSNSTGLSRGGSGSGGREVVRLMGQILVLGIGLIFSLAGLIVMGLEWGPRLGFASSPDSILSDLDRWVILHRPLAYDAWRTARIAVLSTPLRFGWLPLGLLLTILVGWWRRHPDSMDAGASVRVEEAVPGDRRSRRRLLRTAAALRKRGELEQAAEMLWQGDEPDRAAAFFLEAGQWERAAEIRQDQNRFVDAAELYVQAHDFEAAGNLFARQADWGRAAECFEKAQRPSLAAEMYEKGECWSQAAACFETLEFNEQAASCWLKAESWAAAASMLERVLSEDLAKSRSNPRDAEGFQVRAREIAALFERAGQPAGGLASLRAAQCWREAAELARSLERFEEAADFFMRSGQPDQASQVLRGMGEASAAARLLGQHHREAGRWLEAAGCLREAGDLGDAGDLYRQLENFGEAGDCYAEQGDWGPAAEMYRVAGDRVRAAECYERASCFTEAAECWALVGQPLREADLLAQAGEFLRAGECYRRGGREDQAIEVLQQVEAKDSDAPQAAAWLAEIFRNRGQLALALRTLEQGLGEAGLERTTLPAFYALAKLYEEDNVQAQALELYERILAVDYTYEDVEERLARLHSAIGAAPSKKDAEGWRDPSVSNGFGGGGSASSVEDFVRYEVIEEVGRGGMGIVYKARDTALDRIVAFKVLPDTVKESRQAVSNFLREAKAAAKLNHPSIVTVYDTGEQDGHYYIAMEYVDGTTLKEILLRRGVISAAGILHVTVQICEALAYAHEQKIVHRDIKPANAMWTRDKKAKIMDFGLAKVVEEVRNHTTVVAGTPYYMSPEQTLGKNVDHRTDIYSLGVTMFEMATGIVPFKDGNVPYHHVHTPAPDVRSFRPELPLVIAQIVARCLAKDPAKRYASAREILQEIRGSIS